MAKKYFYNRTINFSQKKEEMYTDCKIVVKFVCQLIADLQKGRTYNSYLIIRSCVYILFGGHPSTDKLILQFVYILHFLFWLELILIPFPVWAGINFNSSPNISPFFPLIGAGQKLLKIPLFLKSFLTDLHRYGKYFCSHIYFKSYLK